VADGIFTIPLTGSAANSIRALSGRRHATNENAGDPAVGSFVTGSENLLAARTLGMLLESGAEQPDGAAERAAQFNPLLIYGPHGSGKSHLAHGLAEWWRQRFPQSAVEYCTGSDFARDYAAALAAGRLEKWRDRLHSADLLVLENLGELTSKPAVQQELLLALDALADREARVVLTTRSLPSQWQGLSAALRSRLSAALAVPLALPSQATRRAILESLAEGRGLPLSRQVLDKLATAIPGGVPALVGAIAELELAARTSGEQVDTGRVRELVEHQDSESVPTVREIARLVARHFGLKLADLKSPQRQRSLVAARCVAMYLARQLTPASLSEIGDYFGGRDHTTVLHGCRRTEKLLTRDVAVRQAVADVRRTLASA
jgi:chromosomal replication initiator protein